MDGRRYRHASLAESARLGPHSARPSRLRPLRSLAKPLAKPEKRRKGSSPQRSEFASRCRISYGKATSAVLPFTTTALEFGGMSPSRYRRSTRPVSGLTSSRTKLSRSTIHRAPPVGMMPSTWASTCRWWTIVLSRGLISVMVPRVGGPPDPDCPLPHCERRPLQVLKGPSGIDSVGSRGDSRDRAVGLELPYPFGTDSGRAGTSPRPRGPRTSVLARGALPRRRGRCPLRAARHLAAAAAA
jgi:hypothetical protein